MTRKKMSIKKYNNSKRGYETEHGKPPCVKTTVYCDKIQVPKGDIKESKLLFKLNNKIK